MRVDGADVPEDRRIVRQSPARARADFFQPRRNPPARRSLVFRLQRIIDGRSQQFDQFVDTCGALRSDIDFRRASVGIELMLDPPSIVPKL